MNKKRFFILTIIVSISGLTQGMLLPLIAILLEKKDVTSFINGLHATSIYIGVFLASLFLEQLLRKLGYKYLILLGGLFIVIPLLLFPMNDDLIFWFLLRLLVGVGDNMLHFSTQSWLTESTPKQMLGRTISIYGLSFSLGFMLGPIIAMTQNINENIPFYLCALLSIVAILLVLLLSPEKPEDQTTHLTLKHTMINFKDVLKVSWLAFLFPMMYGVLEASLNSNLPVYALNTGLTTTQIAILLPIFSLGAILFQVPIGTLSDVIGRSRLLTILTACGATTFLLCQVFNQFYVLMAFIFISGACVGSLYSLGVTYMTELTPKRLLPAGNIMCGIIFSIGSISGPIGGGVTLSISNNTQFFSYIAFILCLISLITFIKGRQLRRFNQ